MSNSVQNTSRPGYRKCGQKTEIYSRVTGYFRPVNQWNRGKKEEFKDRVSFKVPLKQLEK